MKKMHVTLKSLTIVSLTCLLNFSCGNGYLDPQRISLNEYSSVINELLSRQSSVNSLFTSPNPTATMRDIELRDFQFNKALIKTFPKSYKLLNENNAIEIVCFSEGCIFFILRKHTGVFKDRLECLKMSNSNKCDLSIRSETSVEKESLLTNGWRYQVVIQYIDT